MTTAIKFENVSKQYRLGEVGTGTLSHDLHRAWAKLRGKPDPFAKVGEINDRTIKAESSEKRETRKSGLLSRISSRNSQLATRNYEASGDYVWALRDINFEVQQGEILGIIGRNGAGKSTLLKILSRVTAPTTGSIKAKGRIASLLEVGTGFHPELTGRENIYLNGAILGMQRHEITRQLDAIIDFSGCAKYVDTPVKRYSSGMTVRLGFAVAAHLDCEILVVDEVLAVGDAEFQKKCIGKMQDVSKSGGRTVLFVSHTMQAVSTLCNRAITLDKGKLSEMGPARIIVTAYLSTAMPGHADLVWPFDAAPSSGMVKLHSVKIMSPRGEVSYDQFCGAPITLSMEFWCLKEAKILPSFHLFNQQGIMVFPTGPLHVKELGQKTYNTGLYRCSCVIPEALLNTGTYSVHAFLSRETDGMPYIHIPDVVSFRVINDGTGSGGAWTGADEWPGVIRPLLPWTCEKLET